MTAIPYFSSVRISALACLLFCGALFPVAAQEAPRDNPEEGMVVRVPNPINESAVSQIKRDVEKVRSERKIRRILFDFNPDAKESATVNYGGCYELAKFIRELTNNNIRTIGLVQARTVRHSVLPVLACSEVVMTPEARLGEVADPNGPPVPRGEIDFYSELAGRPRTGVVVKMIDRNAEILSGLENQTTIYFDSRKRNTDFRDVQNVSDKPVLPAGNIGLYSPEEAVRFGLAQKTSSSRQAVEEEYSINPGIGGDWLAGRTPKAVRIDLNGTIDIALREKVRRQLETAVARKENTVFLNLECGGGDPDIARKIGEDLRTLVDKDKQPIRTIAWIPDKAPDLAAIIALSCSEIVMRQSAGAEAVLGDFEGWIKEMSPRQGGAGQVEIAKRNLADVFKARGLPEILANAMTERDLIVIRARDPKNERRLMTPAVFAEENARAGAGNEWAIDKTIKEKGSLLRLDATLAKELRIVSGTVENPDPKEVYSRYGFQDKEVRESKTHWLDSFAAFLRRSEVSILLVLLGLGGIILEMKAPGLTFPAVVAAICFLLFFWSQSQLSGEIVYLAVLLFALGLVMLGVEIFILPGFGVAGITGVFLLIIGIVLATVDKLPQSNEDWVDLAARALQYGMTLVGSVGLAFTFARYLPKIPYANRLVLQGPTEAAEAAAMSVLPGAEIASRLLGEVGASVSDLRPSGTARFGEVLADVVTEGDFIAAGSTIQVVEVEGSRIVVKRFG